MGAEASDISNNHNTPHTLIDIPAGDITAGAEMTYTMELGGGMGGHPHDITLTTDDFADLAAGMPVTVTSTTGGNNNHSHDVTLTCI